MSSKCLCDSNLNYSKCCKPYHDSEKRPKDPRSLMRSRYCAYAKGKSQYIIYTTHHNNPHYQEDVAAWKKEIDHFCQVTDFVGLEIVSFSHKSKEGYVTFNAFLKQGKSDVSFQEKSHFVLDQNEWKYLNGTTKTIP